MLPLDPAQEPVARRAGCRRPLLWGLLALGSAGVVVLVLGGALLWWWRPFAFAPRFTGEEVALVEDYWPEFSRHTVLLDPGHGCGDSGAQREWSLDEDEVNWALVQAIQAQLEESGHYRVLLTREQQDEGCVGVRTRGRQAARRGADVLISIHANAGAGGASSARGAMLIWAPSDVAGETVRRQSEWLAVYLGAGLRERGFTMHAGGPPMSVVGPRSGATYTLTQPHYGVHLAGRRLGVLNGCPRPAVLVESHFLSTPAEAAEFQRPQRYAEFAEALELGLRSWFAWDEGRLPARERLEGGYWTVQVRAEQDAAVAQAERQRLEAAGFEEVRLEEHQVDGAVWHRVRVGRFTDRATLGIALHGLEQAGWDELWVERVEEEG